MKNFSYGYTSLINFAGIPILVLVTLFSCTSKKETSTSEQARIDSLKLLSASSHTLNDRQLSQAICGSCHLFPEPELLDKKTWTNGVLPHMAPRLGFMSFTTNPYARLSRAEIESVVKANVFPHEPIIDTATWNKIVNFYERESPQVPLKQDNKADIQYNMPAFEIISKKIPSNTLPLNTVIKFNEKNNTWYIGNRQSMLYKLDNQFLVLDSLKLESPPADLIFDAQGNLAIVTMGVMDPNDKAAGKILKLPPSIFDTNQLTNSLDSLHRPVHMLISDMNADGLDDYIICEFGNLTGNLSWYEKLKNGSFKKHVLKQEPGARKTVVQDMNADGLPDIVALMTQGNEGIYLFLNQGNGKFKEMPLLRFPPVYGSSEFELIDFNKDGYPDILYTNGDNADFSFSLKKYHGIRLFLNNGKNNFKQVWFYPLHGASKALARDFDQDGDLDIASIAFFPDFHDAPEEGFVYFENKGEFTFQPQTFLNATQGRWLTMEAGDFDQDQDIDIALGSFIFSATPVPEKYKTQWISNGADIIILKNNTYTSQTSKR